MNIGTLTGSIELDDQLSSAMTALSSQVTKFASQFGGAFEVVAIGAGAAAVAIGAVTAAITALGVRGAAVQDVTDSLNEFAGSSENAAAIMEQLRAGTRDTISDFDLLKESSRLLAAGVKLTAKDFGTLGTAAFVLQDRGLGTTKEMLDLVSDAMVTGRTRALAMKIGVVDVGDAETNFAKTLGVTKNELNESGKAEAHRVAVMDLLSRATQNSSHIQRDFGDVIDEGITKVRNWTDALAVQVANSPAVWAAIDAIGGAITRVFGDSSQEAIDNIVGGINAFADAVRNLVPVVEAAFGVISKLYNIAKETTDLLDFAGAVDKELATAAAQAKATAQDTQSLTALNKLYGTSFTTVAEAVRYANTRIGEYSTQVAYGPQPLNAATAAQEKNTKSYIDAEAGLAKAKKAADEYAKEQAIVTAALDNTAAAHYRLGLAAVAASQNIAGFNIRHSETVAISRDFSATLTQSSIKADSFGHVLQSNVLPSLQGIGGALTQTQLRQEVNDAKTEEWRGSLDDLSKTFSQLGNIGGDSLSKITRSIGTVLTSINLVIDSVSSFKNGLSGVGGGNMLKGIASIASGIGGIVSIANVAIGAVRSLWNWARGGEEGTVVNPARDRWFGGRSVDDIGDQLAAVGVSRDQSMALVQGVFDARTKSDFDAATGKIDSLIKGGGITDREGNNFASGGVVYAARGRLIPFMPRGSDTVPAMLTPGERVLSVAQNREYERGRGREIVIHNHVNMNGREVARGTVRYITEEMARQLGRPA